MGSYYYKPDGRTAIRRRDDEWREALKAWRSCSSKRLSWKSGGHCMHCEPLRRLMEGK